MKNSGKVKVADFGLARTLHQPVRTYTSEIMTLYYKPPEQLFNDKHYASKFFKINLNLDYVDVWSAGCILGEMLRGKHIFSGECELDLVFDIFRKLGIPEEGLTRSIYSNQSPGFWSKIPKFNTAKLNDQQAQIPDRFDDEALDQLRLLQDVHPTKRIPPCQAQQHPWLKED